MRWKEGSHGDRVHGFADMGLQVDSELYLLPFCTRAMGRCTDVWWPVRWMLPHHRHYRLHHQDPVRIMAISVGIA
jgi:hypothetical protein